VTFVVYLATAGHSAVNFSQQKFPEYVPAQPFFGAQPLPPVPGDGSSSSGNDVKEITNWITVLPSPKDALSQMNIILAADLHYGKLGDYHPKQFPEADKPIHVALGAFHANLSVIEVWLAETYPEYTFLLPSQIPQSINV